LFKVLLSLFLLLGLNQSYAAKDAPISWSGNLYKIAHKYKELHKKFSKQVCRPGTDSKYYKLLRQYRGTGFYLPLDGNDIDRAAIKGNLHHFQKKLNFISGMQKKLEKKGKLPSFDEVAKDLKENLYELLELKKFYSQEIVKKKKNEIRDKSSERVELLRKQFDEFVEKVFFLRSYNFPNDHLQNRRNFELYKGDDKTQTKANKVFFLRKIVEDGSYHADHTYPDIYLRSTLDTLYIQVKKEKIFISENLRYDLEWVLRKVERSLDEGYEKHLERLDEWYKRTKLNYDFYQDIIQIKNKAKAKKLVENKNKATLEMKKFVYKKQAEVYRWWTKQSDLMRSVFVLETILFNEVGTVDGKDALERYDVAQIVMNRVQDDFYSTLDPNQEIIQYLNLKQETYSKYPWLNALFRVGEFSFTYHYISSVVKIFCPDMSRAGRNLRQSNIKISLKSIKNYRSEFNVLRYFSRVSMLGKIDMSTVWFDYEQYPERAGYQVANQHRLIRFYLADKYQYLYSFTDPKGLSFQVIKIGDDTFTMRWVKGKPHFYKYRDPHLFKYFIKK
jgi:hypothetical protein